LKTLPQDKNHNVEMEG